jgi:hypothetical protein
MQNGQAACAKKQKGEVLQITCRALLICQYTSLVICAVLPVKRFILNTR